MTSRETILARIREGLSVRITGGHPPSGASHVAKTIDPGSPRAWLPRVGSEHSEQLALFVQNGTDLKAVVHVVNKAGALDVLRQLSKSEGWKRIATHESPLTNFFVQSLKLPVLKTNKGYDSKELEACDVGITGCNALVAQTGSVLITSQSAGGRALSVLPPHHVVVATQDQLVPDLPAAFDLLKQKYAAAYPSFISFITGPSRTGDIERILVLGAHGPKKLTVLCLKDG